MHASFAGSIKSWASRLGVCLPSAQPDEAELLKAIAHRDRQSMDRLYRRYVATLHLVAKAMLPSEVEAEDLVHDVFCEAWQKAETYEPARGSVGVWLLLRLRSRALDRLRSPRSWRMVSIDEVSADAEPLATTDSPAANYLTLVAWRNLAALPGGQRQLLQLLFFHNLTAVEVAGELRIPLGTVKSRLRRTLGCLRGDAARLGSKETRGADSPAYGREAAQAA